MIVSTDPPLSQVVSAGLDGTIRLWRSKGVAPTDPGGRDGDGSDGSSLGVTHIALAAVWQLGTPITCLAATVDQPTFLAGECACSTDLQSDRVSCVATLLFENTSATDILGTLLHAPVMLLIVSSMSKAL